MTDNRISIIKQEPAPCGAGSCLTFALRATSQLRQSAPALTA
jgi:hypothetical protein